MDQHSGRTLSERISSGLTFSSGLELLKNRTEGNALGVVRFDRAMLDYRLTSELGVMLPGAVLESTLARIRMWGLGDSTYEAKKTFDAPSNVLFIPAEYGAVNCCSPCDPCGEYYCKYKPLNYHCPPCYPDPGGGGGGAACDPVITHFKYRGVEYPAPATITLNSDDCNNTQDVSVQAKFVTESGAQVTRVVSCSATASGTNPEIKDEDCDESSPMITYSGGNVLIIFRANKKSGTQNAGINVKVTVECSGGQRGSDESSFSIKCP
jgi:hypothetical protein